MILDAGWQLGKLLMRAVCSDPGATMCNAFRRTWTGQQEDWGFEGYGEGLSEVRIVPTRLQKPVGKRRFASDYDSVLLGSILWVFVRRERGKGLAPSFTLRCLREGGREREFCETVGVRRCLW